MLWLPVGRMEWPHALGEAGVRLLLLELEFKSLCGASFIRQGAQVGVIQVSWRVGFWLGVGGVEIARVEAGHVLAVCLSSYGLNDILLFEIMMMRRRYDS